MDRKNLLSHVDHTLLSPTATEEEIVQLLEEAMHYGTASVCIPPCYVPQAVDYVKKRAAQTQEACVPVGTVVGFPNGNTTSAAKAFEAEEALSYGAAEIDMVINIGYLKARRYDLVGAEIRDLRKICAGRILKVIVETCLLSEEEKIRMCEIVTASGADYIKTSTGFSKGGATFADVALFREHVGPDVKIKAAGGIASLADAQKFLDLGADRLGTSRVIGWVKAEEAQEKADG